MIVRFTLSGNTALMPGETMEAVSAPLLTPEAAVGAVDVWFAAIRQAMQRTYEMRSAASSINPTAETRRLNETAEALDRLTRRVNEMSVNVGGTNMLLADLADAVRSIDDANPPNGDNAYPEGGTWDE